MSYAAAAPGFKAFDEYLLNLCEDLLVNFACVFATEIAWRFESQIGLGAYFYCLNAVDLTIDWNSSKRHYVNNKHCLILVS